MRVAPEIILTSQEQVELARLARSRVASVRLAQRARMVLLAAKGMLGKGHRLGHQHQAGDDTGNGIRPAQAAPVIQYGT